jgi:hypothetical protein
MSSKRTREEDASEGCDSPNPKRYKSFKDFKHLRTDSPSKSDADSESWVPQCETQIDNYILRRIEAVHKLPAGCLKDRWRICPKANNVAKYHLVVKGPTNPPEGCTLTADDILSRHHCSVKSDKSINIKVDAYFTRIPDGLVLDNPAEDW